jgi:hypothetical protein
VVVSVKRPVSNSSGKPTSLGSSFRTVSASVVRDRLAKTARIVFQLAPAEKAEIQETASGFGMTTTEYLLQVHRLFRKLSGGKTPKSVVKGRRDQN